MRQKQLLILGMGLLLFGLSELFPPWLYEDENTSVVRSAGYHFVTTPPKVKSPGEMREIFRLTENDPTRFIWVRRDGARLLGQRMTLGFLILGSLILSFNSKRLLNRVAGVAAIGIGSACLILLGCYTFLFLG